MQNPWDPDGARGSDYGGAGEASLGTEATDYNAISADDQDSLPDRLPDVKTSNLPRPFEIRQPTNATCWAAVLTCALNTVAGEAQYSVEKIIEAAARRSFPDKDGRLKPIVYPPFDPSNPASGSLVATPPEMPQWAAVLGDYSLKVERANNWTSVNPAE
jgi:hypothetical protein